MKACHLKVGELFHIQEDFALNFSILLVKGADRQQPPMGDSGNLTKKNLSLLMGQDDFARLYVLLDW